MTIYDKLLNHTEIINKLHLRSLFNEDKNRFNKFHVLFNDFVLDYSKNKITEETMQLLYELANFSNLKEEIDAMFEGKKLTQRKIEPFFIQHYAIAQTHQFM